MAERQDPGGRKLCAALEAHGVRPRAGGWSMTVGGYAATARFGVCKLQLARAPIVRDGAAAR
jgi:hypothetical protein